MHHDARAFATSALSRLLISAIVCLATSAARADDVSVEITGEPSVVFDSTRDACDGEDVPDLNPRAFRDASGTVVMYALHYINRPLVGPDFAHLKVDCHVALGSPTDAEPAHYNDRNFVTATWTVDGRKVGALVHHEYHADEFKRCKVGDGLGCWYNTILSYRSDDGGRDFAKASPLVVAAAPFRQDVEQGRHRGFFNPSNIVSDGAHFYALISTTGWTGQPFGNCLFRTDDATRAGGWRAWDGTAFSIRYDDPYKVKAPHPKQCEIVGPFVFPVGAIVHHRKSGNWIAVFQASSGGVFPIDGFYYATSRDLRHWGDPKILLASRTLYNDICKSGPTVVGYPSVLDPASRSRNYDEVGDHPDLFLTQMDVSNCQTGRRQLLREQLTIKPEPRS